MRPRHLIVALALSLILIPPARSNDATTQSDAEAMTLAQQILDKGAELYATKDALAMAATYTEDAEITLIVKKREEIKTEVKRGRFEIEQGYRDLFKDAGSIKPKNTVEYARFLDTDMLLIAGVFEPDANSLKVPFVQTRVKQGDKWLMSNLRIFVVEKP